MFDEATQSKLFDYFKPPRRYEQLLKQADGVRALTRYKFVINFVHELESEGIIHAHTLTAKNGQTATLYTSRPFDELSPYEVAHALFPTGYFCNLTSMYYHALTNQIPTTIYLCRETSAPKHRSSDSLTANRIRDAFIKPHRYTRYMFECNGCEIVVVERSKELRFGVLPVCKGHGLCPEGSHITSLERALIDAIVSPHYNGGIVSVYDQFRAARKKLKIQKLLDIYEHMGLVYPYAQAIGFFLERVGLHKQAAVVYETCPPGRDFFIDHDAKSTWKYDAKWRINYPNGLVDEN